MAIPLSAIARLIAVRFNIGAYINGKCHLSDSYEIDRKSGNCACNYYL